MRIVPGTASGGAGTFSDMRAAGGGFAAQAARHTRPIHHDARTILLIERVAYSSGWSPSNYFKWRSYQSIAMRADFSTHGGV